MFVSRAAYEADRVAHQELHDALRSLIAQQSDTLRLLHRGMAKLRARIEALEGPRPAPGEPALPAITPAVLAECEEFAYGDRTQLQRNRSFAYSLARKGKGEDYILRALRLGEQVSA